MNILEEIEVELISSEDDEAIITSVDRYTFILYGNCLGIKLKFCVDLPEDEDGDDEEREFTDPILRKLMKNKLKDYKNVCHDVNETIDKQAVVTVALVKTTSEKNHQVIIGLLGEEEALIINFKEEKKAEYLRNKLTDWRWG